MRFVVEARYAATKGKNINAPTAKASAYVYTWPKNPVAKSARGQVFVNITENDGAAPSATKNKVTVCIVVYQNEMGGV